LRGWRAGQPASTVLGGRSVIVLRGLFPNTPGKQNAPSQQAGKRVQENQQHAIGPSVLLAFGKFHVALRRHGSPAISAFGDWS
jgi:hypothetical protein